MTANVSQTQSARVGDQVLLMAIGLKAPAALRYSEIQQRYGEIFGLTFKHSPCLNCTQTAAKLHSKDQHALDNVLRARLNGVIE